MKFLVDEMPFWASDCPFYDQYEGTCRLDDCCCEYMKPSAGDRCEKDCRWLKTVSTRMDGE